MSKPMAVSLPVVLLILDWYPFGRIRSVKTFRDTFMEKLPFIALSAGSSVLTMFAQQSAMKGMEYLPLTTRLLVAVNSLIAYLWKMVLPLNLVPLYPYPTEVSVLAPAYLFSILLVAGITVACVIMAKRKRLLFLSAWGYYVVTLLPVLGIVQVGGQAMADRYSYLPSLAPFLLTGLFAGWILGRITALHTGVPILKFLSFTATVLVFVSLAYLTFRQIGVWKNSLDFWNYVISKENGIYIAYNNRGFVLRERGEFDKALSDYSMAIDLNPSNHDVYNSRGIVYEKMGQFDRALEDFDRALALSSSYYDAYNSRGLIYEKMGRLDSAIEEYKKGISLNPDYYEALNNLGVAYAKTEKIELAIATLTRAIEADPNKSQAYSNIALVYSIANQPARALENYIKAIGFDPKDSKSYHGLGTIYMKLGRFDDALAAYTKFVELSPDDPEAYKNRGIAYAAKGDFSSAGADFRKACSLGSQESCNYLQDPRFR
jgi:tetratricopeptide (TPR) repeat protein